MVVDSFASDFVFTSITFINPGSTTGSVSGSTLIWNIGTGVSGMYATLIYEGYYTSSGTKINTASNTSCSYSGCSDTATTEVLQPEVSISKQVLV